MRRQERAADYGKRIESGPVAWDVGADPRVELMSIIFKLAGNPEYNRCKSVRYKRDIQAHFGQHRDHPVVRLAAELRESDWVGHDVPMGLAVDLTDANDFARQRSSGDEPVYFSSRWGEDSGIDFVEKVHDFAEQTDFYQFFADHQPLYEKTSARLRGLLAKHVHFEWFEQFFGPRSGVRFRVVPAMVNGKNHYAARAESEDGVTYYCILGVYQCSFAGLGNPRFNRTAVPIVIHEFCHSYCNPLVDAHMSELEEHGRRIASELEAVGKPVPYGNWQPLLYESVVRSCVISYLKAKESRRAARRQLRIDMRRGFRWLPELSDLIDEYEANRNTYPTFGSFFPRIVEFMTDYKLVQADNHMRRVAHL